MHSLLAVRSLLLFFFSVIGLVSPLTAQTSLQALLSPGQVVCCVATDSAANVYTVNTLQNATGIGITKTDSQNNVVYSFGVASDGTPAAVAVDAQQNVFIVGNLGAGTGSTSVSVSFVSKINAADTQTLFTRLLGGATGGTSLNAVTTDPAGNVYVAGTTTASDYPVTSNAYQTAGPVRSAYPTPSYAVLTELSADGSDILYSTFIGGGGPFCDPFGSSCLSIQATSTANAVAIAPDGSMIIAGYTNATGFPTSSNAFQPGCNCNGGATGFISSFKTSGALNWSTYLGSGMPANPAPTVGDVISSMAVAPDGSVVVAGTTDIADFQVTANAFQSTPAGIFISKLSADGSTLVASTYLGGSTGEYLSGLALDSQQNVWVGGVTQSSNFPILPGSLSIGNSFVVKMNPTLTQELQTQLLPTGDADNNSANTFTLDSAGNQVMLGLAGTLLRLPNTGAAGTLVLAQANSADYTASAQIAPGELISLWGIGLGPNPGIGATLDSSGGFPTSVGGTQVMIDGVAAPILYAGPNQVNAIAPFEINTNPTVSIQVVTPSATSETAQMALATAVPELPSVYNPAPNALPSVIALNQDYSLNSPSNPAKAGSIVIVYAFGTGLYETPMPDGSIAGTTLDSLSTPVSILFNGQAATILYEGSAPDLVAGVTQINFRLPATVSASYNAVQIQSAAGNLGIVLTIAATN